MQDLDAAGKGSPVVEKIPQLGRADKSRDAAGKGYNIILAKRGGDRRSEEFISNSYNITVRKVTIKTRLRNKE